MCLLSIKSSKTFLIVLTVKVEWLIDFYYSQFTKLIFKKNIEVRIFMSLKLKVHDAVFIGNKL